MRLKTGVSTTNWVILFKKKKFLGLDLKILQQLRVLIALPEDLDSFPNTRQLTTITSHRLLILAGKAFTQCTDIYADKTPIHIKNLTFLTLALYPPLRVCNERSM